jgi:periplasmic protein TonB
MEQTERFPSTDHLGVALLVAATLHALAILGIGFAPLPAPAPERLQKNLEVIVVRTPIAPPAIQPPAEYLAEVHSDGGGETRPVPLPPQVAVAAPAESPPSVAPKPHPTREEHSPPAQVEPARLRPAKPSAHPPAPEPLQSRGASKRQPAPKAPAAPAIPAATEPKPPTLTAGQLLASTRLEAARLSEEMDRTTENYSRRLRRKHISASTQEYNYAAYLDAWRRKVERLGNLNYPEKAKKRRLFGNLVLTVALYPDGRIANLRLIRSSGQQMLDDAAMRIVRLAAPFAPFPSEIRAETDILEITRTWQFLSSWPR